MSTSLTANADGNTGELYANATKVAHFTATAFTVDAAAATISGTLNVTGTSTLATVNAIGTFTVSTAATSEIIATSSASNNYSRLSLINSGGTAQEYRIIVGGSASGYPSGFVIQDVTRGANPLSISSAGAVTIPGTLIVSGNYVYVCNNLATPAGGISDRGFAMGIVGVSMNFGSGAPTMGAVKGSLYLRTDGSGTNDRLYVNTNGSTNWTAVVTVA